MATPSFAATPEQVDKALEKAKAFLYSKQKPDGTWEDAPQRDPKGGHHDVTGWQFGGLTAVATYALLAGGESPQEPKLQKAIAFLKNTEMLGFYAVGFRAQVWHLLPQTPDVKAAIKRDARTLMLGINKSGKAQAMYNYYLNQYKKPQDARVDHSVSQLAVLGMWSLEQTGLEVPLDYWRGVDAAWKNHQLPGGAWGYDYKSNNAEWDEPRHTMAAAGVATLFITQDYLRASSGLGCTGNVSNEHIDLGLKWVTENFKDITSGKAKNSYYALYGVERIGVASGLKYFGDVDWYTAGAERLVKSQSGAGSWTDYGGDIPGTSYGIVFLARGRAPVVMNKLEYAHVGGDPKKGGWNQRPRDVANVVRWIGKQAERDLNWQIVNLQRPAEELSDAPILYIAGSEPPDFSAEHKAKLKTYIDNGGMIVANADCGGLAFATSIRKLAAELFPLQEFRELPAEHVIYTNAQFQRSKWRTKPSIMGMSNGVREVMLLIPQADPAKQWQTQSDKGKEELFQLMANIFLYAVDKQGLQVKGLTHLVKPKPDVKADRTIKLARLEYSGNWNPEPGGWRRLANVLLNDKKTTLTVENVKLGSGNLKTYKLAHLTGTTKFTLDEAAKNEIKAFVAGGGTLIVDSAGGQGEFAASAESELREMFPAEASGLDTPLPAEHAIYSIPDAKITAVGYRPYARTRITGEMRAGRLRGMTIGGRTAVIYSPEDLSAGLVGQQVDGIIGYDPETSTAMMRNIILHANAAK
jgi:hypothetical protein